MLPQPAVVSDRHPSLPLRLSVLAASALAGLAAGLALLLALSGTVSAAPGAAPAAVIQYPGGAGCTTTLQACLNNAPNGSTIQVQPNTYLTNGLTLDHPVSLTGVSSATVILQALPNQRVLTVTGAAINSSVIISGLTFENGHAVGADGGGLLIQSLASPRLVNLMVRNNQATNNGGGIAAETGALSLAGVVLQGNVSGASGGGLFALDAVNAMGGAFLSNHCLDLNCTGGAVFGFGDLTLTGTQLVSNTSLSGGGAIRTLADLHLSRARFQDNSCSDANCLGGAASALALAADNTQFVANHSTGGAGALYILGAVTLNASSLTGNYCTQPDCFGGATQNILTLVLTNTSFFDNHSVADGGAAYSVGSVTVSGGQMQGNTCSALSCTAGGLYAALDFTETNTLFLSNTAGVEAGAAYIVGRSHLLGGLFQGNACLADECFGGALYAVGSLSGLGVRFSGNNSASGAGAAYVVSAAALSGSVLDGNYCSSFCNGGALWVVGSVTFTNTQFSDNQASYGGALYTSGPSGRFVNNLFADNRALFGQGKALMLDSTGQFTLLFNTFGGADPDAGSAIYVTTATVGLTNTLFAHDDIGLENLAGAVHEDYSLFSDVPTHFSGAVISGGHSFSGTAGFVDVAADDYHLSSSSDAIDRGTNAGIAFDVDGDPRPIGSGFDIGYDEFALRLFLPLVRR